LLSGSVGFLYPCQVAVLIEQRRRSLTVFTDVEKTST